MFARFHQFDQNDNKFSKINEHKTNDIEIFDANLKKRENLNFFRRLNIRFSIDNIDNDQNVRILFYKFVVID